LTDAVAGTSRRLGSGLPGDALGDALGDGLGASLWATLRATLWASLRASPRMRAAPFSVASAKPSGPIPGPISGCSEPAREKINWWPATTYLRRHGPFRPKPGRFRIPT